MNYGHATANEKQEINQLMHEVEQNPNDSKKLTRLGALLFSVCFFPPGITGNYLKRALLLDPLDADALFWLALCLYHDVFEYHQAKDCLEKALLIDPTRADCWSILSAVTFNINEDHVQMLNYIDKAIMYEPTWITPRKQRIWSLIELQRFSEARQEVDVVQKLVPQAINTHLEGPECYYEEVITGRASSKTLQYLQEYLEEIAQKEQ